MAKRELHHASSTPMSSTRMTHKVFICHSSHDKLVADAACAALEAREISCWIAPRNITPGEEYGAAIIRALDECEVVLIVFSSAAHDSPQVRREVERALSKNKILLPFRIEDVMPTGAMEYALMGSQWCDAFVPPIEPRIEDLCRAIAQLVSPPAQESAAVAVAPSPQLLAQKERSLDTSVAKGNSRVQVLKRERLGKWVTRGIYALVGLLMLGWGLQEQGGLYSSDSCNLRSTPQENSPLMDPAYKFLLKHSTKSVSDKVSVVAIESSLGRIQSNVCPARSFTADLIDAAASEGAAVIAIDKFYGADSCPDGDPGTQALKGAIANAKVPILVGESTHAPADEASSACLVLTPQLDLGTSIHHGLTRLNQDVLKLPLRWPVLPNDAAPANATPQQEDSFSLMAATQEDLGMRQEAEFTKLYTSGQQPYANLAGKLERQTASNLLCTVAPDKAKGYGIDCSNGWLRKNLKGKVVVIGAESDQDYPSVLGEGMYGFELQARYVAALLSGSYLRDISPLFLLFPLAFYYALSELLIPYMHIHRHPPAPLFHIEHPLRWTVGVYGLTMALGILVPLAFHRFPPLGMMLGVSGILIPRLLVEGWALMNERAEDPEGEGMA